MARALYLVFAMSFASPLLASSKPADPTIAYANRVASGDISYRQGWFGKGDTRLHYVEAGQGPLIIFYHGFPSYWLSWFDQMEALKERYHVVAVDGLGAGLSGKPEKLDSYKVERLARQVDALAKHLNGGGKYTLVGHDWGAALAFSYAQAFPKRLNAVVGMGAPPYNLFLTIARTDVEQQRRSSYMQRFQRLTLSEVKERKLGAAIATGAYRELEVKGAISAEEGALFRATLSDPDTMFGGINWYRANVPPFDRIDSSWHWPRKPRKTAVPTLLIWGEADKAFLPSFIDHMDEYGTNVRIVRLDDVGHWVMMEAPDRVNGALTDFLALHHPAKPAVKMPRARP